jgi:Type I restriction modification DNA specificity domain
VQSRLTIQAGDEVRKDLRELGKLSQGLPARVFEEGTTPYSIVNVRNLEQLFVSGELSQQLLKSTGQLEEHRLKENDILIAQRNQPLRASLVKTEQAGAIAGQNLAVLRLYGDVDAVYITGLLRSSLGQTLVAPLIKQSTAVTLLSLKDLGSLKLPVPSLKKQRHLGQLMLATEEAEQLALETITARRNAFEAILVKTLGER